MANNTVSKEWPRPRLVLMMPLRRCGSHALRLRLNASPQFHSPYPLHIVDFLPLLPLYGDLEDDDIYFQLVVDVVGLQAASPVKWEGDCFDPVEIFEHTKDARPRSVHRIVGELLIQSAARQGALVVMDKSLDTVHNADELMELFPDMLFVNVVRDPRAQVSSINRAIIHEFDTMLNTLLWARAQDVAARVCAKYPDRVLTVRFEDFIDHQEAVLRRLCAFMGLEFNPAAMLDIKSNVEAAKLSGMSALWENNRFDPIPANATKFKQLLPMEDIELIEQLLADYMRDLGYEAMTFDSPSEFAKAAAAAPMARTALLEDAAAMEAARERSAAGRVAAWAALRKEHYPDFVLRTFRADYLATAKARLERQQQVAASC